MSEDVLYGTLDRRPEESDVIFFNISLGALEEILDIICENVNGRFSGRELR